MAGMIHGSRISLSIGFVAVGIAVIIGVILGALAGYFGFWIDMTVSRLFEIMLSIPTFFLLITVAAIFPPSIFMTMIIIGLTSWVGIARFTRSEFLRIRSLDYVTAAISLIEPRMIRSFMTSSGTADTAALRSPRRHALHIGSSASPRPSHAWNAW